MTQLSVNVNKLATLRNSRGKNLPDVLEMSRKILAMQVHGLTVHPRPDGRHIRRQDVVDLKRLIGDWNKKHSGHVEFNIEGYPADDYLKLVQEVQPDQCTLVPDPPEALTSNAGWDLMRKENFLFDVVRDLKKISRVSLFVDPATFDEFQAKALAKIRPDRIELYTEAFADTFGSIRHEPVKMKYVEVADQALRMGIGVNAGHDLNQRNLGTLIAAIPKLAEVSIGHAIFCEALEEGLATTIANYLKILKEA